MLISKGKTTGAAILFGDQMDLNPRLIKRGKEGNCIIIKAPRGKDNNHKSIYLEYWHIQLCITNVNWYEESNKH